MREHPKEKKDKIIISLNLVFIACQILLVFLSQHKLPPQIPLFYSQPWGEDQLAPKFMLALLPLLCAIILVLNTILSRLFKDKLIAKLMSFSSLIFAIFCLLGMIQIIRLVVY